MTTSSSFLPVKHVTLIITVDKLEFDGTIFQDLQDLLRVCVYSPQDLAEFLYQSTSHHLATVLQGTGNVEALTVSLCAVRFFFRQIVASIKEGKDPNLQHARYLAALQLARSLFEAFRHLSTELDVHTLTLDQMRLKWAVYKGI